MSFGMWFPTFRKAVIPYKGANILRKVEDHLPNTTADLMLKNAAQSASITCSSILICLLHQQL